MGTEIQNRTAELGTQSVGKLLFRLALPAITAQIINLLYNVVDRMYIGHMEGIGKLALTGVGVCLPLLMIISAFASLIGYGGAPRASIFLGRGDKENAERTLGNSVTVLVIFSIILTLVFQFFSRDMLMLFGASENTIDYALDYILIYSLGTVFVQLTLGLNPYITAQGFAKTSMLTVLIGASLNIVLDPIFIFTFDMGVRGAALATIISQAVSMVWILFFLTGKKSTIRIKKKFLRLDPQIYLPCLALGLGVFIMQLTESLLAICFNSSLYKYGGDVAVGSMTILTSVMQASMLPLMGLGQGAQPIISYNYGAKNAPRVRSTVRMLVICCLCYSMAMWLAVQTFPQAFIQVFNNDPELVSFTIPALKIYMLASGIFGIQMAYQQSFVSLGNAKSSLAVAIMRKIILLIPLIYIMPALNLGVDKTTAVFMAEPIADILSVIFTVTLFSVQFKKSMRAIETESDSHGFSPLYKFIRGAVRLFTPSMKTTWKKPFSVNPSIFICNHDRAYGPIAMCAYFDKRDDTRPWINADVLSAHDMPEYVRHDYWWDPDKWYAPIFSYTMAYIYAGIIPPILRGSDCIGVHHDTGAMATLRTSVKYLKDGKHILLFPEHPDGYGKYQEDIFDGFISLGKLFYGRTKQCIDFYPVYADWKAHEIRVNTPVTYDPAIPLPDLTKNVCTAVQEFFKSEGAI